MQPNRSYRPGYTSVSHYGKFPRTLKEAFGPHTCSEFASAPDPASRTEKLLFGFAVATTVVAICAMVYFQ